VRSRQPDLLGEEGSFLSTIRTGVFAAMFAVSGAIASTAIAQEPASYSLDGETIRVVLPQTAGGNFDAQTRLLIEYMEKYLPGDPTIVVQNLRGANGARMMEYVSQLDPADDLVMYTINGSMPFRSVIGEFGPELFDPRAVNWVGSFRGNTWYCAVSAEIGVETVDDMVDGELLFGAASVSSTSATIYSLLAERLGLSITTIAGFDSVGSMLLAIERGELDGLCNNYSGFQAQVGPAIDRGKLRLVFYLGPSRRDDIAAPYLGDLFPADRMGFVNAATTAILFGGPYAIPSGADPQFVAAMREAFVATMADPEFQQAAAAYGVDVQYESPETVAANVEALFALPPDVIDQIGLFFGD
jgi:tripartite-type tricarboxylate transporter receptor subunit TctC